MPAAEVQPKHVDLGTSLDFRLSPETGGVWRCGLGLGVLGALCLVGLWCQAEAVPRQVEQGVGLK